MSYADELKRFEAMSEEEFDAELARLGIEPISRSAERTVRMVAALQGAVLVDRPPVPSVE